MIKINLIPREILDKELQRQRAIQAGLGAAAVAVLAVGISLTHYYRAVSLEKTLAGNEDRLQKLQKIVAEVEQYEATLNAVRARLNVIVDLLKSRPLYPYFMEDLLKSMPGGVWLISVNSQNEGSQLKLSITARASSSEDVAAWLRHMESSDRFSAPALGPVTVTEEAGQTVHGFTLGVRYAMPPGPRT